MKWDIKKICVMGMLSALAYVVMVMGRIPVIMFLSYDPKDVIITIGGFLYGPLAAFIMTVIVAVIENFTVSDTGPIGLLMNIIAGSAFACTAAFIYSKRRNIQGAVIGLVSAWIMMTVVMVLWNYLITPIFMDVPRQEVAAMLIPIFVPFNLIKGGLNAALTMLLYKPVKTMLEKSNLMPAPETSVKGKFNWGVAFACGFVILTCVMWVLVLQGHL